MNATRDAAREQSEYRQHATDEAALAHPVTRGEMLELLQEIRLGDALTPVRLADRFRRRWGLR